LNWNAAEPQLLEITSGSRGNLIACLTMDRLQQLQYDCMSVTTEKHWGPTAASAIVPHSSPDSSSNSSNSSSICEEVDYPVGGAAGTSSADPAVSRISRVSLFQLYLMLQLKVEAAKTAAPALLAPVGAESASNRHAANYAAVVSQQARQYQQLQQGAAIMEYQQRNNRDAWLQEISVLGTADSLAGQGCIPASYEAGSRAMLLGCGPQSLISFSTSLCICNILKISACASSGQAVMVLQRPCSPPQQPSAT